jgi:Spy/CpxP family protein refolding chaperone
MKLTRYLLVLGLFAAVPLIRAEDAPKADKAPAGEKGERKKGGGGRMNPDQMVARYDEALTLTADQKTKIKDIITANMEKAKEAAPEDRRTIMQGLRDQIRALLTPEQQTKFDAMPQRGTGGGKKKAE